MRKIKDPAAVTWQRFSVGRFCESQSAAIQTAPSRLWLPIRDAARRALRHEPDLCAAKAKARQRCCPRLPHSSRIVSLRLQTLDNHEKAK